MFPYRDSRLTRITIGVFFLIVIGYAYFELRGILYGPTITVISNANEVHDQLTTISGRADRIASLTMNGEALSVTENGVFEEPYLLAPGLNRIVLDAKDKYGRTQERIVQIVYTPSSIATSTLQSATSSPTLIASSTVAQ